MDVREKLLDLIIAAKRDDPETGSFTEWLADYLIANGVTVQKWIPVSERLPDKMGQYVCRYVFGENTDHPFFQVLWYFANSENPHFQHEGSMGLTVTHWMPLPEPPKEEA